MNDYQPLWQLATRAAARIVTRQNAETESVLRELGFPPGGVLLFYALDFAPEPISAARLSRRMPYTNPALLERALAALEKDGWLERAPRRSYTLTGKAHSALERILTARRAEVAALSPLPEDELHRLAALLAGLVQASLAAPDPPGTAALRENRNSAIPDNSPPLALVVQYLSDLTTFREACTAAAWRLHDVEGYMWEALALVARNEAYTAADLAQKLGERGYGEKDYARAITRLNERGWVEVLDGEAVVTEAGQSTWDTAEANRDAYFFAPWANLTPDDAQQLADLLTRLDAALSS